MKFRHRVRAKGPHLPGPVYREPGPHQAQLLLYVTWADPEGAAVLEGAGVCLLWGWWELSKGGSVRGTVVIWAEGKTRGGNRDRKEGKPTWVVPFR